MDEMTQQNAALVEQAAAAAQSMQDQAAMLARSVSVFKLDAGTQYAARIATRSLVVAALPARGPMASGKHGAVQTHARPASKPRHSVSTTGNDEWEEF
ncbi:MAG: hypothetical protein H7315_05640 [Herminiimonas sp.]|nr:hypothetical protein [Herminiimonas sp.]